MDEMPKMPNYTPEELMKMQEEALKKAQETWNKLTPEEQAKATAEAQRMMEEEARKHQEMMDTISRISAQSKAKETAQDAQKPKFCPNCGTPVSGGKFCGNCGQAL
ncbi:MAG: hypothetical protein IKX10_10285 [Lachnospiraceae bacterium]|nr:hypothetical protein [Lachnospiraceae bacterium]